MKNKLQIISYQDNYDYRTSQKLLLNGEAIHEVYDLSDCPEDAIIGRDLTSANDVLNIIKVIIEIEGEFEFLPSIEAKTSEEFDNY